MSTRKVPLFLSEKRKKVDKSENKKTNSIEEEIKTTMKCIALSPISDKEYEEEKLSKESKAEQKRIQSHLGGSTTINNHTLSQ